MDILIKIERKFIEDVKRVLLNDEIVSKGSIKFRDGESLSNEKGIFYCYISGNEDICKKAIKLIGDKGKEVKDKDKIIQKIKKEEDNAISGFGAIFG